MVLRLVRVQRDDAKCPILRYLVLKSECFLRVTVRMIHVSLCSSCKTVLIIDFLIIEAAHSLLPGLNRYVDVLVDLLFFVFVDLDVGATR